LFGGIRSHTARRWSWCSTLRTGASMSLPRLGQAIRETAPQKPLSHFLVWPWSVELVGVFLDCAMEVPITDSTRWSRHSLLTPPRNRSQTELAIGAGKGVLLGTPMELAFATRAKLSPCLLSRSRISKRGARPQRVVSRSCKPDLLIKTEIRLNLDTGQRRWERAYNTIRPHHSLGRRTPARYLQECFPTLALAA
jgi:hypothetical protein